MQNIKNVSVFAACGFVLSLISGIFSKSGILKVFGIALLWALIFAALSFLISIIYSKFLDVPSDGESVQSSKEAVSSMVGQNIDLVIQDQELERGESSNHYNVGNNHQMLSESDIKNKEIKEANIDSLPQNSNPDFVPIRNLETFKNVSSVEAKQYTETESKVEKDNNQELDTLPDMSEMVPSSISGNQVSFSSDNSNFGGSFSESSFSSSKDVSQDEVKDASLMAKAISSILSEET